MSKIFPLKKKPPCSTKPFVLMIIAFNGFPVECGEEFEYSFISIKPSHVFLMYSDCHVTINMKMGQH